jgi:hypothetical protein
MRARWYRALNSGFFAFPVLFAQATANDKTGRSTQPTQSENFAAFSEVMSQWWLWLGIVALIALVGVLIYLRNKPEED